MLEVIKRISIRKMLHKRERKHKVEKKRNFSYIKEHKSVLSIMYLHISEDYITQTSL